MFFKILSLSGWFMQFVLTVSLCSVVIFFFFFFFFPSLLVQPFSYNLNARCRMACGVFVHTV